MDNKFFWESVGDVVSQVYEVEADDWDDAKRKAFPDMAEGDRLAECPPDAIKEYDGMPDYHYIDEGLCINYARLERGVWANLGDGNGEYWEDRAWTFSDDIDDVMSGDGRPFTDWRAAEED